MTNVTKALAEVSLGGKDKVCVVVGGTTGIGAAIARQFAKLGCSFILVLGRNAERGKAVCAEIERLGSESDKMGVKAVFIACDIGHVVYRYSPSTDND